MFYEKRRKKEVILLGAAGSIAESWWRGSAVYVTQMNAYMDDEQMAPHCSIAKAEFRSAIGIHTLGKSRRRNFTV